MTTHTGQLVCVNCREKVRVELTQTGVYTHSCGCEWCRPSDTDHMGEWVRAGSDEWEDNNE